MINIEHLSKKFGQSIAVHDISYSVPQGKTLVLLGTSGSGKTTTLRMLNRLVKPDAGTITINGENILSQSPEDLRRSMGYVLQGYGLFPHYTVAENIAIVPTLLKWPHEKIRRRVEELLDKLHLPPGQYRNVYPSQLSGGQRQRVGLARALAAYPPILLMDEPFGALDPLTRLAIRKEFTKLDELMQKTVVMVTHDVQEAFELGDAIGLMDGGVLQQIGTPSSLLFRPANDFVKTFFQHQRLQLEWQSTRLKSLWTALPNRPATTAPHLKSDQTVWEALAQLSENSDPVSAFDEETATTKEVTFAYLQNAIQQQKEFA